MSIPIKIIATVNRGRFLINQTGRDSYEPKSFKNNLAIRAN